MEATTSPEDYRRFDDAGSIEFYTDPARIPVPAVLSPTSDWDALSRAGSAGRREPMKGVTAHIGWPGAAPRGLPDIYLEFEYTGQAAIPLFGKCSEMDEGADNLSVCLWRFRVTGQEGATTEACFCACLPKVAGRRHAGHGTGGEFQDGGETHG